MKAIILTGGLGTRLRPLTLTTPKALLPVLNTPFLSYQLAELYNAGVTEVILASGPQTPIFKKVLQPLWSKKLRLKFAQEKKLLGTAGAIRFAYEFSRPSATETNPIFVLNGDILFDIDYRKLFQFHNKVNSAATIAMTEVADASRFGLISTAQSGKISRFLEKPKHCPGKRWINAGVYLIHPKLIQMIPSDRPVSIEREIFPLYLKRNCPIFGYKANGYWNDIGTPESYLKAHQDLWDKKKDWTEKSLLRKRGALIGKNCRISARASFSGHVCIGNSVIVGPDVTIVDSVIFDGVRIQEGAFISGAVIGKDCVIGQWAKINSGTVLGDKTIIPTYTRC